AQSGPNLGRVVMGRDHLFLVWEDGADDEDEGNNNERWWVEISSDAGVGCMPLVVQGGSGWLVRCRWCVGRADGGAPWLVMVGLMCDG
ncbi:hypothetical protein U1Q18_033233, partial [Sarracenia purpurea var. burkii]